MYTPDEIDAQVAAELHDEFLRRSVASLMIAYEAADRTLRAEHDPDEMHDLVGHVRRAKFETELRGAARLSGLEANVVEVASNRSRHTEVVTPTFRLVAARVEGPGGLPPHASHRETLASSGQLVLAGQAGSHADRVFGVFAHSRSQWATPEEHQRWGHLPGSLHLVFPGSEFGLCIHRINLFERHEDVVREHAPTDWESPMLVRYIERSRYHAA